MKRTLVALGILGFVCGAAQAQEAKPGSDLKKLDFWNGEWTFEVQGKDRKSGEEWKVKGKGEQVQLGDHFYVWRDKVKNADGEEFSNMNIGGYDPVKKAHFVEHFGSDGGRGTGVLTFSDKSMTSDTTALSATGEETRERCTYSRSEQENTGTCEILTDGEWWVSSKAKFTKVK